MITVINPQQPTKDELEQLYSSLNECKVKPVCLSLVETYIDEFISKTGGIPSIRDLFDEKYINLHYTELLEQSHIVEISLTYQQIEMIEKETINHLFL